MLSTFDCGGTILVESEFDKNSDAKFHWVTGNYKEEIIKTPKTGLNYILV